MDICKISERDFRPHEAVCNRFHISVPPKTGRAALKNPLSYSHIARLLGPLDELTIVANDASWYARYLVLYADRHTAQVRELEFLELTAVPDAALESEDYSVKHIANRAVRWTVIRNADKTRVMSGMQSREEALAWVAKQQSRAAA